LDLGQVNYASPSTLLHLMERCDKLIGLCLERCDVLDDQVCAEIAKNTRLRYLDLSLVRGLTPSGLRDIMTNCTALEELNLAWANHTNDTLRVVFETLPESMRRLNLSGTRDLVAMNDDAVEMVCERCPNLIELDLSDNVLLSEVSVVVIRERLPLLRVLTLARCYGIEPMEFLTLNHLDELNIFGCLLEESIQVLRYRLNPVKINESALSTVAHPTNGCSVTSIWGQRTRDWYP